MNSAPSPLLNGAAVVATKEHAGAVSSHVTVLVCDTAHGKSASKTWRRGPDGRPQLVGFDAGWQFLIRPMCVDGIRSLAALLSQLEREPAAFVIRGVPVEGLDLSQAHPRRKRTRGAAPPTFTDRPGGQPWVMLDVDGVSLPFDFDPHRPEVAIQHVIGLLPLCFSGVSCFWQLSSKAGMSSPRTLSLHLWYWLDRPVSDDELTRWSASFGLAVDTSLFHTVQPHYVAAPRFEDGLVDPLPRRSGLFLGSRDAVAVPHIPERLKRRQGAASAPGQTFAHYEQIMAELGDGPGKRGFHNVIRDALWAYVMSGRTDFEAIKADVRRRVEVAPKKEDRDPDYLEDTVSDDELDRIIDGACEKRDKRAEVTREQLERFAKAMKRAASLRQQEQGLALERVVKGENPGPGMIDKLVHTLADPDVDAGSLARLFEHSLRVTPGAPTVAALQQQIEQAQRAARDQAITAELQIFYESTARIREAFGGARDWPYTDQELEGFAADAGCTRAEFMHRWIIQHGKQFYIYFAGDYHGPLVSEELQVHATVFLAPASSAGVELRTLDARGRLVPKSAGQLMTDYGTPARQVRADLAATRTTFDASTHTLVEAPCPLRALEPAYDPDVDEWLRLLAGAKREQLLNWIAALTRLDKPSPALVLIGATGAGKSLLAAGLARLWREGEPAPLAGVMGTFNSAILDCPLVFGDESIPRDWRGYPRTEELRELIARSEHPLRRKYAADATVRGAIRLILAANNHGFLATPGDLTNEDIDAIAQRLLYIAVNDDARAWLEARGGRAFTERLVQEDRIARHALWLRATRAPVVGGRWAVPGDCDELLREMRTGSGLRWALCHWICSWLFDEQAHARRRLGAPSDAPAPVRVIEGKLYVHAESIRGGWSWYLPDERVPDLQRLRRSLEELCVAGEKGRRALGARTARVWMRQLRLEHLITWAEAQGERGRGEVLEAIAAVEARQAKQAN